MKSLLITLIALSSILMVRAQDPISAKEKESLIATATVAIEKYCKKNYAGMLEKYTNGATLYDPSFEHALPMLEWIEARKKIDQNYENYRMKIEHSTVTVINDDIWVLVYGQWELTSTIYKKSVSFPIHFAHRMTNGKIAETRAYFDRLAILKPLGFEITPPSTTEGK